jgi:chromosome segregation ATPase
LSVKAYVAHAIIAQRANVSATFKDLIEDVSHCKGRIQVLEGLLQCRTNRLIAVESELDILRGEHATLNHRIDMNGKNIHTNDCNIKSAEATLNECIVTADKQTEMCADQCQVMKKKLSAVKSQENETVKKLQNIQSQLSNLQEPRQRQSTCLKGEVNIVKNDLRAFSQDLEVLSNDIRVNRKDIKEIRKKHAAVSRETSKLQKSYADIVRDHISSSRPATPEKDTPVDNKGGPETKQSDSDPIPVKISRTVNNMSREDRKSVV